MSLLTFIKAPLQQQQWHVSHIVYYQNVRPKEEQRQRFCFARVRGLLCRVSPENMLVFLLFFLSILLRRQEKNSMNKQPMTKKESRPSTSGTNPEEQGWNPPHFTMSASASRTPSVLLKYSTSSVLLNYYFSCRLVLLMYSFSTPTVLIHFSLNTPSVLLHV